MTADDWPVPGTAWAELALAPGRGLTESVPTTRTTASYLTVPSLPTMTDVPNISLVEAGGASALTGALPLLTQSGPRRHRRAAPARPSPRSRSPTDVDLAGPVALDLALSTTTPGSGIWAVLSDVAPDGSSHPLTVGRLSTSFPGVVGSKSLYDDQGRVVQPYGDFTHPSPPGLGQFRRYQVELWPVGNRFRAGHRIRVQLVGTSLASPLALPGLHTVRIGGADGARLRVPVLPGRDLGVALGR